VDEYDDDPALFWALNDVFEHTEGLCFDFQRWLTSSQTTESPHPQAELERALRWTSLSGGEDNTEVFPLLRADFILTHLATPLRAAGQSNDGNAWKARAKHLLTALEGAVAVIEAGAARLPVELLLGHLEALTPPSDGAACAKQFALASVDKSIDVAVKVAIHLMADPTLLRRARLFGELPAEIRATTSRRDAAADLYALRSARRALFGNLQLDEPTTTRLINEAGQWIPNHATEDVRQKPKTNIEAAYTAAQAVDALKVHPEEAIRIELLGRYTDPPTTPQGCIDRIDQFAKEGDIFIKKIFEDALAHLESSEDALARDIDRFLFGNVSIPVALRDLASDPFKRAWRAHARSGLETTMTQPSPPLPSPPIPPPLHRPFCIRLQPRRRLNLWRAMQRKTGQQKRATGQSSPSTEAPRKRLRIDPPNDST
jgi:hypothetical protein